MRVIEIGGEHTASSWEEIEPILRLRREANGNSFLLLPDEDDFPQLTLQVRDEIATLFYAPQRTIRRTHTAR